MYEIPGLIPTIREIFMNGHHYSHSDSNRVARTSRVFKIGIERELLISVEGRVFIKNE